MLNQEQTPGVGEERVNRTQEMLFFSTQFFLSIFSSRFEPEHKSVNNNIAPTAMRDLPMGCSSTGLGILQSITINLLFLCGLGKTMTLNYLKEVTKTIIIK